jgi:hypothetical protein
MKNGTGSATDCCSSRENQRGGVVKSIKHLLSTTFLLGLLAFSGLAQAEEPPNIIVPPDVSLECGGSTDPSNTGAATATGGCDDGEDLAISFFDFTTPGICSDDFTIERTWTATDACGSTATAVQFITVQDTTPPFPPASPADLNLECSIDMPPPVDLTASDNCSADITTSPTFTVIPGACSDDFIQVRTWTFADDCGNTSSISQTITVEDIVPPAPPAPPADLNLDCVADLPSPVDLTAVDNCAGPITVSPTANVTPGNCENDFSMIRTWTWEDACGNTASTSQHLVVLDDQAPSPPAPPADLNLQCADDLPPPVDLTTVDNCDGSITASPTHIVTPGFCANDFNMVRNWTFSDVCGNTASVAQTFDVLDDTAPVITCPPDGSYETATASDNCTSPVVPTFTDYPDGTRTWEAADECQNNSMCSIILCESDPMTAGYWNRQCLGVAVEDGGLSPGRNGRGPKSPTEPDFEEVLMECADLELAGLGFFADSTCSGIDARPANDDCERALRQLTSLVLNVCSGRLQDACPVCLASCGFDGADGNVAELIDEITADIHGGFCKQAAEKAALVNEGEGLCVFDD